MVRAWREKPTRELRCRVIYSTNVLLGRRVVLAASTADQLCNQLRDWLTAFDGPPSLPPSAHVG
jgi:hypothetical protein